MVVYDKSFYMDNEFLRSNEQYRNLFRMLIPLETQNILLEKCGDRIVNPGDFEHTVNSLDYSCETNLPPEQLNKVANILRTEVSFIAYLRLRLANVKTFSTNLISYNPEFKAHLQSIVEGKQ
jgi:hypothetical protein